MKRFFSVVLMMSFVCCLFAACAKTEGASAKKAGFQAEQLNQPELKKYKGNYYTINQEKNSILVLDENLSVQSESLLSLTSSETEDKLVDWQGNTFEFTKECCIEIRDSKNQLIYSKGDFDADDVSLEHRVLSQEISGLRYSNGMLYFVVAGTVSWDLKTADQKWLDTVCTGVSEVYSYDLDKKKLTCLPMEYMPYDVEIGEDGLYAVANESVEDYGTQKVLRYDSKTEQWQEICTISDVEYYHGYTPSVFSKEGVPEYLSVWDRSRMCAQCQVGLQMLYGGSTVHGLTDHSIYHIVGRPVGEGYCKTQYCIPTVLTEEEFEKYTSGMSVEQKTTLSYTIYDLSDNQESGADVELLRKRFPGFSEKIYFFGDTSNREKLEKMEAAFASVGYTKEDYELHLVRDAFSGKDYGTIDILDSVTLERKAQVTCSLYLCSFLGNAGDNPIVLVWKDGYKVVELDAAKLLEGECSYSVLLDGLEEEVVEEHKTELMLVEGELIYRVGKQDQWEKVTSK